MSVCARTRTNCSFRILFLAYMVMCTALIITWVAFLPSSHLQAFPLSLTKQILYVPCFLDAFFKN